MVRLLAISNNRSVNTRETVFLTCVGYGAFITWSVNGEIVRNTPLVTIYEENIQSGRVVRQSILRLCSVGFSSAGNYTCNISDYVTSVSATTQLMVTGWFLLK